MTSITLEAQAKVAAFFPITITAPEPKPGELWAGVIISADGKKRHHLYMLPGESAGADWDSQMAWAKSIGGDLPDRVEQALAYATLKEHFKDAAYWSNEKHASDSYYAWYQYFDLGFQFYDSTGNELRARAFRRSEIL